MLFTILFLLCWVRPHLMQGIYISECGSDGLIQMEESQSFNTKCHGVGLPTEGTLHWRIHPWRQNQTLELVCSSGNRSCTSHPEVKVRSYFVTYSHLVISKVERAMFNSSTLTCGITLPDEQDQFAKVSCLIDVTYLAEVGACRFQVHKEDWTVMGSCDVTKVYSSAANYGCTVEPRYNRTFWNCPKAVANTSSLTSITETSSGLVYYRGQCQFTVPVPSLAGSVTFSVRVTPGSGRHKIKQKLSIEPPSAPELNNCGQEFLVEGGHSPYPPCACRVTSLGSPAGRLVWRSGDVVLLSGDYGVTQLLFPYEKMNQTHSGKAVKCQVDWVIRKNSTSFTANIAYGPDTAEIFVQSDEDSVTLLCTSLHVHPVSALLTVWGGLCQGQQGRTCILTMPFYERGGKNVTCTLTNQKVQGKQATVTWTLKLGSDTTTHTSTSPSADTTTHTTTSPSADTTTHTTTSPVDGSSQLDSTNSSLLEGVGIGVGVTLFVVLFVMTVLLVLLWRRRLLPACPCYSPTYASPSRRQQREEAASHTCTDLSHYEPVGAASPPRQQGYSPTHASPSRRQQQEEADSHIYTDLSDYEPVGAASPPRQQENTDRRTTSANHDNSHVYTNTAADTQV